jgi:hypothetical protein
LEITRKISAPKILAVAGDQKSLITATLAAEIRL